METFNLAFDPQLPIWLLTVLSVCLGTLCLLGIVGGIRGALVRSGAAIMVILALTNPSVLREERTALSTIVPVIIDETTSQKLNNRDESTRLVLEKLREQINRLKGYELLEIPVSDAISGTSDLSTVLFGALQTSIRNIPRKQIGASIFITDGQVHDIPKDTENANLPGPLHVLITGDEKEKDRRIIFKNAPRFGVVGEMEQLTYLIEETGFGPPSPVTVTVRFDGEVIAQETVIAGEEENFIFEIPHAGKNIIELEVESDVGEITVNNNRAFSNLTGIREDLRVLLVSGEPHAGERTWRNLLKSDASVDLVHFTILRPPEKQDGTPISQLSLIAFPTRELFVQKIDEFDLIIFDRYKRRGVLPILYFDNIAQYVRDGGAVLVAAGPEYAGVNSLGSTPLSNILPALASGTVQEGPFKPRLSATGLKHPVTRNLKGWDTKNPDWSHWFRLLNVTEQNGQNVMEGSNQEPLLILKRHEEGRVALFLSDHVWLWSRGFEGGGPHVQLLRRLAHWLMQEPELEEERLSARADDNTLTITRQTLGTAPGPVLVETPDGDKLELGLEPAGEGLWQAEHTASRIGLYRVSNDKLDALVQVGPENPRELAAATSTTELLRDVAVKSGGTINRIAFGTPHLISIGTNSTTRGNGWIGLPRTQESVLNRIFRLPLFTGLLGLAILLLAFAGTWYREGR